jgi:hypothetical protein
MEEATPSPKPGDRTSAGATALDSQQLSAVQADAAEPLIILAPPGSGKTSTICWRMIRFICELEATAAHSRADFLSACLFGYAAEAPVAW